jgi:hypothetical protein
MTIRQILRNDLVRSMSMMGVGLLCCIVSVVTAYYANTDKIPLLFIIGVAIIFGSQVHVLLFIKCPKCSGRMGHILFGTLKSLKMDTKLNNCPYCKASLDVEMNEHE